MHILSKIFNGKSKYEGAQTTIPELKPQPIVPTNDNTPPLDLFIDNEAPRQDHVEKSEAPNRITTFIERNYYTLGVNQGYEYHSQETMEIGKKKLKAEFQLIIDQSIQEKSLKKLELKNLVVQVSHIAETTKQMLENNIEGIDCSLRILQKQQELCAENEGWVMNVIHSYHQGFIQGLNDFISGENFLNSIKNI